MASCEHLLDKDSVRVWNLERIEAVFFQVPRNGVSDIIGKSIGVSENDSRIFFSS
jgi:hypothetical protein